MLDKVRETIEKYNMFQAGDKVVVAVSGGPDSLALLHALQELKGIWSLKLSVAHFNHRLRPEASEEARYVSSLADRLSVPVYIGEGDVARYAGEHKLSTQVAARELRYDFLSSVLEKTGSNKLALAHQADDQAETIVMYFLRGPSPKGLAGIPPVRGKIVRPLIETGREEIEQYLQANRLEPVIDPSNFQKVYLRNRIRLELMPVLKEYNPNLPARLVKAAELFRDEDNYLEEETSRCWEKLCSRHQDRILIDYEGYQPLAAAVKRRLLRRCFHELTGTSKDLGFEQVDRIYHRLEAPDKGKKLELPGGVWVQYSGVHVIMSNRVAGKEKTDYAFQLEGLGTKSWSGGSITVEAVPAETVLSTSFKGDNRWKVQVDGDKIKFPLTVRNRRPGDRFYPLGLGGSKKLKDFFIDLKLPHHLRDEIPIVVSADGEIVWVAGLRLDERFKITETTRKVFCLSYEKFR